MIMRIFLFKDLLLFLWDMELRASLGSFLLLPVIALSCGFTLFILLPRLSHWDADFTSGEFSQSGVFFWLLVPYLLSILTIYLPSISRSFVWYIRLIYTCFYGESSAYLFSRIYDLGLMLNPVDLHACACISFLSVMNAVYLQAIVNWPKENLRLSINTPVRFEHDFVEEEKATELKEPSAELLAEAPRNSEHGNIV
uniref:Uncharacterized protein n=1 Tax=Quercus lobata TaxID=97700 RepID=A0A7N2LBC1_QUELO